MKRIGGRSRRIIRRLSSFALYLAVLLTFLWACAALWIDGPRARLLATLLVAGYAVLTAIVLVRFRPIYRSAIVYTLPFALVLAWWLSISPSNEREWQPDVARLPLARMEGDIVHIDNVRDFDYRSSDDFVERWETRSYDLSRVEGVDLFISHWGSPLIAHTFVSWDFEGASPLTISIETRKEVGESYSAVRGFFRQYELYYVVSDESDVARLRTNFRGETVYLYRLRGSPEVARALLLDYLESVNALHKTPAWYNALVHNCTTSIRQHVRHVVPVWWDWRVLVNGYLDEAGYDHGTINNTIPFDELRQRSRINDRAKTAGRDDYSERIRDGLPARPSDG